MLKTIAISLLLCITPWPWDLLFMVFVWEAVSYAIEQRAMVPEMEMA
jgi:hypothetical protein